MADIFISYAREDRETAQRLARALEGQGWSVWWDTRLKAGEIWDEMIERELKAARSVVVLWSGESVSSRWVRKEARYGDTHRMLFPALIQTVDIPFEFSDVHAEDLCGWAGDPAHLGLRDLVDALAILLGEPARLQPKQPVPANKKPKTRARPAAKKPSAPEDRRDFSVFRDVDEPWCPEMVVLPAGEFVMGSPDSDEQAFHTEKPQHKVTIGTRFAVGRYPLVVAEYSRFVEATSHKHEGGVLCYKEGKWGNDKAKSWRDPGFAQTNRQPVVGVSWEDATAYAEWLGKETGESYRLLSEAEWEYACRAGKTTRYSCGETITEKDANFDQKVGKTTEVGSYPANPWGLYDLHGNVWEWAEDVWHADYKGSSDDGGAWTTGGDSGDRVLRGGSWVVYPWYLRSANRVRSNPDVRNHNIGFRVARTL